MTTWTSPATMGSTPYQSFLSLGGCTEKKHYMASKSAYFERKLIKKTLSSWMAVEGRLVRACKNSSIWYNSILNESCFYTVTLNCMHRSKKYERGPVALWLDAKLGSIPPKLFACGFFHKTRKGTECTVLNTPQSMITQK